MITTKYAIERLEEERKGILLCYRDELIDFCIEALKKADRYRWHDAEEELPETSDDVLVYHTYYHVKADCIKGEIETGYMYKGKWHGQAAKGAENVIIAWKYIEPYEEESR